MPTYQAFRIPPLAVASGQSCNGWQLVSAQVTAAPGRGFHHAMCGHTCFRTTREPAAAFAVARVSWQLFLNRIDSQLTVQMDIRAAHSNGGDARGLTGEASAP